MKSKLKAQSPLSRRALFDRIDSLPEGFYYVANYIGSVTIMEVIFHEGKVMVARAGRSKLIPLAECSDGVFVGPIPVPPSCCSSQSDLSKIVHLENTGTSIPVPLLCSFVLRVAWWCIRHTLRRALAKGRHYLSLSPLSFLILSNDRVVAPPSEGEAGNQGEQPNPERQPDSERDGGCSPTACSPSSFIWADSMDLLYWRIGGGW